MRVEIHIIAGPAKGQRFFFDKPDCFLFGRTIDAHVSLPGDSRVSRQHFLLEISPPECKICDLDSKNGTFVNGIRYGGRTLPKQGMKQAPGGVKEKWLKDSDEISVGDTRMRVSILNPAREISKKAVSNAPQPVKQHKVYCARCNKEVTEELEIRDQDTTAEYVCKTCREKGAVSSIGILKDLLLNEAITKESSPLSIKGYRIEESINRGGMGVVYKATELKTGKSVAIKTTIPHIIADSQKNAIFQREVELTCQLKHPHIVQLVDHGNIQETFYFVLEFVDGMNLRQFIEFRGGSLALDETAPIMLGVLDGLAYAHRATIRVENEGEKTRTYTGIVHRDLKPENILLTRKGDGWFPKIADFGTSKSFESAGLTNITKPGDIVGTPMYWPREQITHYRYLHPATDVFSIAGVFYEVLTGSLVREGFQELFDRCKKQRRRPGLADYIRIIARNPPIPICMRNPEIPEPVGRVIDRALQEVPVSHNVTEMRDTLAKLRYSDAGAFRDALVNAFEETGVPISSITGSVRD